MLKVSRDFEEDGVKLVVTDVTHRPVLHIQPMAGKKPVEEVFLSNERRPNYLEDPDTPTTSEWPQV